MAPKRLDAIGIATFLSWTATPASAITVRAPTSYALRNTSAARCHMTAASTSSDRKRVQYQATECTRIWGPALASSTVIEIVSPAPFPQFRSFTEAVVGPTRSFDDHTFEYCPGLALNSFDAVIIVGGPSPEGNVGIRLGEPPKITDLRMVATHIRLLPLIQYDRWLDKVLPLALGLQTVIGRTQVADLINTGHPLLPLDGLRVLLDSRRGVASLSERWVLIGLLFKWLIADSQDSRVREEAIESLIERAGIFLDEPEAAKSVVETISANRIPMGEPFFGYTLEALADRWRNAPRLRAVVVEIDRLRTAGLLQLDGK